jgi:cell division protease FtsH
MHAIAKALLEWETIDSDQLDDIIAGRSPRPPKDYAPSSGPGNTPSSPSALPQPGPVTPQAN